MKNMKMIAAGMLLTGVMIASAQLVTPPRAEARQREQEMAKFEETSTKAFEQGNKFAVAADYLRMALVLGLGVLIGRMSAVSYRELTELKTIVTRLASSKSQLTPTTDS